MTSKVNMQEEIQKMIDECFLDCGFGGSYKAKTRLVNALLALIKKHEREVLEKVLDYVEHERDCILNGYSAGRPTKDGGYETKIGGKWYQARPVDETPKCNCGLSDILAKLKEVEK